MADTSTDDDKTLPIGSLKDWWKKQPLPLLDLRSERKDLVIKGSVHVPLSQVKQRSYELPPREIAFAVLVPTDGKEDALELIQEFFLCRGANRRRRAQKPWKVPLVVLEDDAANWEQAKELDILETNVEKDSISFQPLPRLWQPDSMIRDVLLPLLSKQLKDNDSTKIQEVWDLGAGAGRDVCFLAEELKSSSNSNNVCVVAMDQRYRSAVEQEQEECLFWKRRGVEDVTRFVSVQWGNNDNSLHEHWFQRESAEKKVLCLYMVRFWNKTLVEFLAQSELLEKGTLVAVSQFTKASPGATWDFEHPKEKHVLEREELSQIFATGWTIRHDEIVQDSDHGRTLVNFVAEKD